MRTLDRPTIRPALLLAATLLAPALAHATEEGEVLLDDVTAAIERRYYARRELDRSALEAERDALRDAMRIAPTRRAEIAVANALVATLGVSHTFVLPRAAYEDLYLTEMQGKLAPHYGFTLDAREERLFVDQLLDGAPAEIAGLRRGDEVLAIDGFPLGDSPRLVSLFDRGTGARPGFELDAHDGRPVRLLVRRTAGGPVRPIEVRAEDTSRNRAARASVRTTEREGKKLGYIHLFHVLHPDAARALEDALAGPFHDAAAVLVDLRGWGGRVDVAQRVVRLLTRAEWRGRVVALVDERSRSAKEVISFLLAKRGVPLIGRKTAGAVLGCAMIEVKPDEVLVLAVQDVDSLTDGVRLEGHGVEPTVRVPDALPYADGRDEIVEAGIRAALELAARAGARDEGPEAR
jgi:C-terminal processing protease CtpA/Prc